MGPGEGGGVITGRLRALAVLLAGVLVAAGARAEPVHFWLTVLHHNDGESALLPQTGGEGDAGGIARFLGLLNRLRIEASHGRAPPSSSGPGHAVVVLGAGDSFLAGPLFTVSLRRGPPFLDALALELAGYDALGLGNHEFDFGPGVLADFVDSFQSPAPPLLSANLDFEDEVRLRGLAARGRLAASTVLEGGGERIGVIGVTTPALAAISAAGGVRARLPGPAVQAEVERLERLGVNKIVLLSHLQSLREDLALVAGLRGVDLVVSGGGDELLANPWNALLPGDEGRRWGAYPVLGRDVTGQPVPLVTTSGRYRYLGRLLAGFSADGRLLEIDEAASGPVRVAAPPEADAVDPDPRAEARIIAPLEAAVGDLRARAVATTTVPLDGRRERLRTGETNLGNLVADALLWQARRLAAGRDLPQPAFALQNSGGIRSEGLLQPGRLSELDLLQMLPFPGRLVIIPEVGRERLKALLENAVARVEFADGRFAQLAGLELVWTPAGSARTLGPGRRVLEAGTRVLEARLTATGEALVAAGTVVPGPPVAVATLEYLARGGDGYPLDDIAAGALDVSYQEALQAFVQSALGGVIDARQYPRHGLGRVIRRD